MIRAAIFAGAAWLSVFALTCSADEASSIDARFSGWPETWADAYRRFEAFIAARRASWPKSDLEIAGNGAITHSVRIFESRTEHLTLNFFRRGRQVLGMMDNGDLFGQGRSSVLTPGKYAACLWASTAEGYQYVYPIRWFEISSAPNQPGESASEPRVKMTAPPGAGEEVWPNERELLYLDFQIFPHAFPRDIEESNRKVKPDVILRLEMHGAVRRERLANEVAEKLLRWRIYRDGKLVDRSSASGVIQRETDLGPGTYLVWLGVEGPSGFMPVSNLLHYPLFPDGSGKDVVIPAESRRKGVPDFLESLPAKDARRRELFELWESWKYDLNYRPPIPRPPDQAIVR